MTALSPQEALARCNANTGSHIPGFVIDAVNELLLKKLSSSGSATLFKNEVVGRIINSPAFKSAHPTMDPREAKNFLFEQKWLDFEPVFRNQGWRVDTKWPAFNETYEGRWVFEAK